MKVAIVNLTGGNLSGGYRKYLKHLVPALRVHPLVSGLTMFVPPGHGSAGELLTVKAWPQKPWPYVIRWLRHELRGTAPDVVFIPTARLLRVGSLPTVIMVRNMEPLLSQRKVDNSLRERATNFARRIAARRAARQADRVVAVSHFVRDTIVERWGVDPSRIGVVYHGVESPLAGGEAVAPAVHRWLGGAPFLFTAGSIRPARGLVDLIGSWPRIRSQIPGVRLVIAGNVDRGAESHFQELRERIADIGADMEVYWSGGLDPRAMAWCYRNAAAFVMTSRIEACPNVALEAMSYGALCISTDAAPMPEVFSTAAGYYRAESEESLAAVAGQLLLDVTAADRLRAEATRRAADFTWARTAARTIEELSLALQGKHPDRPGRERRDGNNSAGGFDPGSVVYP